MDILVMDDDQCFLGLMGTIVEMIAKEKRTYFNITSILVEPETYYKSKLHIHHKGRYDLVITDRNMGCEDGVDFARSMRERGCTCPIFICTSSPDDVPETPDLRDIYIYDKVDIGAIKKAINNLFTDQITISEPTMVTGRGESSIIEKKPLEDVLGPAPSPANKETKEWIPFVGGRGCGETTSAMSFGKTGTLIRVSSYDPEGRGLAEALQFIPGVTFDKETKSFSV